jgi:glycosyltransferase involved in cell wall biosynthesis
MNILYLYSEVMDYSFSTIQVLVKKNYFVHMVYWDSPSQKVSLFKPTPISGVGLYKRSDMSFAKLVKLIDNLNPSIIVVSGWMDRLYVYTLFRVRLKNRQAKVICAMDNQWTGTIKQKIARLLGVLGLYKIFYDYAWIAGFDQYEFARMIGFKRSEIVFDYYSADLSKFKITNANSARPLTKKFLFVGRLTESKNIELLISAWDKFHKLNNDWSLTIVGHGPLNALVANASVNWIEYLEPFKLVAILSEHDVFILPSKEEHWGVVIHEAVSAGLPIISSDACGASKTFVIPGFNGFTFRSGDLEELLEAMLKISMLDEKDRLMMGENSKAMSMRITPQTSAYNILSVLR